MNKIFKAIITIGIIVMLGMTAYWYYDSHRSVKYTYGRYNLHGSGGIVVKTFDTSGDPKLIINSPATGKTIIGNYTQLHAAFYIKLEVSPFCES